MQGLVVLSKQSSLIIFVDPKAQIPDVTLGRIFFFSSESKISRAKHSSTGIGGFRPSRQFQALLCRVHRAVTLGK